MRTYYQLPEPAAGHYVCYPDSVGRYNDFPQHNERRAAGTIITYNLHIVCSGGGYVMKEGQRVSLKAGEGFLYPRGAFQHYGTDPEQPWDVRWVHFMVPIELMLLRAADASSVWLFAVSQASLARFIELTEEMYELCGSFETRHEPRMSALLYELLAELAHNSERLEHDALPLITKNAIREAADLIRSTSGQAWTLPEMAALCGYSPYYFLRLFRQVMGRTPQQYLTACRIAAAKSLLVATKLPVSEIASRTGFSQSSYFIRVFRKAEHVSPKAYRELYS
ncbi:AraC family transcriptional regulator [Paenibacillus algorifonticola]|uniref:AraC family transcriptional regulator n=1 Tax=Paenibacillus algorifonticola TaxID=684063 RepID=UPI003D2A61D9